MTLTYAYETATRPKRSGEWRRFTEADDAAIAAMCAAGASYNQIAAELGRHRDSIRSRAKALGIVKVPVRPGPGASHIIDAAVASALATVCATHCRRCGVLLTRAPAGHDDVCGWCEREATS